MIGGHAPAWPRSGRRLLVAALVAGALAACRSGPKFAVDRVVVGSTQAMRSLEGSGVAAEALAGTASRLLERSAGFVAPRSASDARHVLAQVMVDRAEVRASAGASAPTAHVAVTVSLEPLDGSPTLREMGRGSAPVEAGTAGLRAALEKASFAAVASAIEGFSIQIAAERKKSSELLRDLASRDASLREHAMRVLATRGDREAVPALIERLRDPDPAARERAIGALSQLRDPRAVRALIELTHRKDPQYVAQLARIIGDIGGEDAYAWLLTMAWGNPEQVVRTAAQEALAEMKARDLHAARAERP